MKKLFIYILLLLSVSCTSKTSSKYLDLIVPEDVYTKDGIVTDYAIDPKKPCVVTLITGIWSVDFLYGHTPENKINKIIAENPEFDFIFYFDIDRSETEELMERLTRYNIDYPVIFDYDHLFADNNKAFSKYFTTGTLTCNQHKKFISMDGMIGTSMSFFDSNFPKTKKKILK